MLLTCALAFLIWVETANSLPQLFPDSHQSGDGICLVLLLGWRWFSLQPGLPANTRETSFLSAPCLPTRSLPLLLSPYSLPGAILIQKSVIKSW